MVDQVTAISTKIGSGGRLYKDARKKAGDEETPTPEPSVEKQAPEIPKPWVVASLEPESVEQEKSKSRRDWRQLSSTLLEICGMGALTAGFAMLHLWLGIIVLGFCLILLGVATGLPADWSKR